MLLDTLESLIANVELLDVPRNNIEPKQRSDFCVRKIWIKNSIRVSQQFRPLSLGMLTSMAFHFLTYKMGHSKIIPVRIKCQHLQSIWHPVWMAHSKCLAVQFYFYRVVYGSILYLSNLPCLYVLSLSPGK